MTASQIARQHRREARQEMERQKRMEVAFGAIILILTLAAFAAAGTMDVQSQQAWQGAWAEQNGMLD